jgi:Phage tail sheath protein subtilisin-like domain/Phage tail sheath C-terminal domain
MARTIQSPGIQISEVDLSLRANLASTTNILIPGFAPKGPSSDPVQVSTLSEFEQIFGLPTNAAERYFYHTTKAVFSSPANVTVYRLPYGEAAGLGTSNQYSALVYPAATVYNSLTSSTLQYPATAQGVTTYFGKPTHVRLSEADYYSVLRGDAFTWSASGGNPVFDSLQSLSAAGLIVLNKSQASVNNRFEGLYLGIVDNTALNPSTSFDDFTNIISINTGDTYISDKTTNKYITVPSQRLNFALSATSTGLNGSVSEVVENIATFDTSTANYNDTVNIGVFKLRQSTFSPDTIQLDYVLQEGYNASFDYYRQINSPRGGSPVSYFLENVDDSSRNIITLVNPNISNRGSSGWLGLSGVPNRSVRFLSEPRKATSYTSTTSSAFLTLMGCTSAQYDNLCTNLGTTNALIALGDYSPVDISTKTIGNIPAKLSTMFNTIENSDLYPLSITCEAGLGTIYANSFNPSTMIASNSALSATSGGYFDDSVPYTGTDFNSLTAQDGSGVGITIANNYRAVASQFIDFAANRRKDHLFIADPLTNIFVQNGVKTIDDPNKNFSDNIYWPLRNLFSYTNNSYTTTYANVVKVADISSNRQVWVPFSGFAASIMANVDANQQPWVAPAGFNRGTINGIVDLAFYPKQKQRDQLYKISLNPVVFFPNEGFVVYGQKTLLKQPSAFDRINVRRLFLTLENQTNTLARAFVFEPNTLFTRTQLRNALTPIFDNAKNTAGLYDYLLICDERNNTPSVIDDNTLVIDIYIKPVRTAEFILVNFYATRTSQNFSEIVA